MRNRKPRIRFKSFKNGEWLIKKLSEITNIQDGDRGMNYPSSNDFIENGHTLFLSANNVTKKGFSFEKNQYITNEKSNKMGNGKIELNDLILTTRGSIGHIALYSQEIKERYPFARINSGMLIIRPNNVISSPFIMSYLSSPLGKKQIKRISFGSAQPQLTKKDISNYEIALPIELEEQQKIGEFFKQLDDRIALQQRHVEQLKQSKQGFLQKMFPKDGEFVPEVRFDEYYNQWANVRLGDITDFTTGTSKTKDINSKGKYFVMDMGSVSNTGQNIAHKKVNSSDGLLCSGDLIMPKDDIGGGFIIGRTAYIDQDNKYVLGDHVYKLSVNPEKVNSLYLHFYINTPQINIQFKRLVTGSAQLGIRSIYLCDESILIPSISEQQKIGEFFKQLDDLIAKNERELELLQETKKGFLQKMFV